VRDAVTETEMINDSVAPPLNKSLNPGLTDKPV